jgi:hypothetical protein
MNGRWVLLFCLLMIFSAASAQVPEVTVRQIQEVPPGEGCSPYADQVVHTSGIVTSGWDIFYAGYALTFFMEMNSGGPFTGVEVYSNDGLPLVRFGDSISFNALVLDTPSGEPPRCGMTIISLMGNFVFHSFNHPDPPPLVATAAELSCDNDTLAEQFEGVLTRVYDVTVDSSIVYSNVSIWYCHDNLNDSFLIRSASDSISYIPESGTRFAYIQGLVCDLPDCYYLQPRYERDLAFLENIDPSSPIMPEEMLMIKSYPNPFNNQTKLAFQIQSDDRFELAIYDILARKIEVLFCGDAIAGNHQIIWDATTFPSGIYFAALSAQGKTQAVKLTLLK